MIELKYASLIWYLACAHYSRNGSISFCIELPFIYMLNIRQGSLNYHFKIFCLPWLGIEPRWGVPPRHGEDARLSIKVTLGYNLCYSGMWSNIPRCLWKSMTSLSWYFLYRLCWYFSIIKVQGIVSLTVVSLKCRHTSTCRA